MALRDRQTGWQGSLRRKQRSGLETAAAAINFSQQLEFWSSLVRSIIAFIASAAINWSMIPAVAPECVSNKDLGAALSRWATLPSQPASAVGNEKICRDYAASFYEFVTLRQAAAKCVERERKLAVLDSEINAFNDLLATKCGSFTSSGNGNPRGTQMILYPLMTTWIWFQIFTASPLLFSSRLVDDTSDADISLSSVRSVIL
jgi:hypothetical protein